MIDIPKVWYRSGALFAYYTDVSYFVPMGEMGAPPASALPLVPQASRDELREALAVAFQAVSSVPDKGRFVQAALDVLTERGHVQAEPTEENP